MYLALYRAYRPERFEEVLGQEHIVKILGNQIKTDTVSHAYLFCGTRGTGKTTMARLLAKGVNCSSESERPCGVCENCKAIKDGVFLDVIEIDAASNNGVDNIRELRESVKYPPAAGKKKVYIVDEVHMLSQGAFNALLKTLEEPPEYAMFILATTEPQKLPSTILSRCMRLDFKRVPENLIKGGMKKICDERGVEIADDALQLITINADGSVRDGLSILDQCIAQGDAKVTRDDVLSLLGASSEEVFIKLADKIKNREVGEALLLLDKALADGKDARQFLKDFIAHYRKLLIVKFVKQSEDILNLSCENAARIGKQSEGIPVSDISRAIIEISKASAEARWSTQPRILLELCVVTLAEVTENAGETTAARSAEPVQAKKAAQVTEKATHGANESAREPEETPDNATDFGKLWKSLFEGEDALKGKAFTMLNVVEIKSESNGEYVLAVKSDTAKNHVDQYKRKIEELLEKRTGAGALIKNVIEEVKQAQGGAATVDEMAAEVENLLGISVDIIDTEE